MVSIIMLHIETTAVVVLSLTQIFVCLCWIKLQEN